MGKARYRSKNNNLEEAVGTIIIAATVVAAEFVGEHVCIFGENVANFLDKTFNPQPPKTVKPETLPDSDDILLLTI
jgi:hypothetical protein